MKPIVLFDADGVLTLPEEVFSVVYSRSRGLDPEPFEQFFRTEWRDYATGKRDLKQAIADNPDLWQWHGSPDELLHMWFATEDVRNQELIELIAQLKTQGVQCYLATEQEKYRAEYMRTVMFDGLFDGYFVTAELGVTKSQPEFYELILARLRQGRPELQAANVIFYDDSQPKIDTAKSVGIDARLYTGVEQVRQLLG